MNDIVFGTTVNFRNLKLKKQLVDYHKKMVHLETGLADISGELRV